MSTFLIKQEKTLTRQEGDTADVSFLVPAILNMANYEVTFVVVDAEGTKIIDKNSYSSVPAIDITDQLITIPLVANDTKGHAGEFRWEVQLSNDTPEIITIGRGDFIIIAEIIT